jgi:hypothetical protein
MYILNEEKRPFHEANERVILTVYNQRYIPLTVSYFLHGLPISATEKYIRDVISDEPFNAKSLVKRFNADPYILPGWSAYSEEPSEIILQNSDGRAIAFLKITKVTAEVDRALGILNKAGYKITVADLSKFR